MAHSPATAIRILWRSIIARANSWSPLPDNGAVPLPDGGVPAAAGRLAWKEELRRAFAASKAAADFLPADDPSRAQVDLEGGRFPMLVPEGYAELIDWADPADPLRVLLVPQPAEESDAGSFDQSGESTSTVARGLQHKYSQTAAMMVTQACAAHCRYCFRRRLMSFDVVTRESVKDLAEPLNYIANHPEIDNVLLTGGDPMVSSTGRLAGIFESLSEIPHVRQVRISTKLLAFLPSRFDEPDLTALLKDMGERFQIVFRCHYDHPREIHAHGRRAIDHLKRAGCLLTSQIACMAHINDNARVMGDLLYELHLLGIIPQYVFHPRPVRHTTHFQMPIVEAMRVMEEVRARSSGPVKRFRYIMTLESGKLELVGLVQDGDTTSLVARWHQLRRGTRRDPVVMLPIDDEMVWLDEAQLSS